MELAMTFTGFPLYEDMFPERPGQRRRGLPIDSGQHNSHVPAFRKSICGKMGSAVHRKKMRQGTASPSGPLFQQNGTNEHARVSTPAPERSPWWQPRVHRDRRPFLLGRARMVEAARAFFSAQSFIEVDTAILQMSPGNNAHTSAFAISML